MKTTILGCSAIAASLAYLPAHAQNIERSGEQVVKAQCVKCHATGVNGAPKIDDRAAWAPRMRQGLDATVRSAIRGHGAMPARGGMANLTDTELRAAISYMFYPGGAALKNRTAAAAEVRDPHLKVVDGMEVRLGIVPAGRKGVYRVNVSLRDSTTKADIGDATVEARVANALGGTTKKLDPATFNHASSYGGAFNLPGNETYTIALQIRRPGAARPSEASFDFKP